MRLVRVLPRRRPFRAAALAALTACLSLAGAALADDPFDAFARTIRKEVEDGDAEARLRAWQRVADAKDPRAVDLALEGTAKEGARRDAIAKSQTEAEAALEVALAEIEKANAGPPPATKKEIEKFNKRMKGVEDRRDAANAKLRDLAVDAAQQRAVLQAAATAVGKVVDALPPPDRAAALEKVAASWAGPKATWEDRVRWVEALTRVRADAVSATLRAVSLDEQQDARVRGAAIDARLTRADPGVVADAIALLASTASAVQMSAIEALRSLHRKEAIEPLIAFLGREDIGEARSRAHRALKSLTGEKHGPYRQPWADWWQGAKATFTMPEKPMSDWDLSAREKGLTFYGIPTFSNKLLFVLDVSGSMNDLAHEGASGERGNERKIDVLRKELAGVIDLLDETKTFNLILFNHRVIRYQAGSLKGDRATREAAKRWALPIEPSSGTNIGDALETAFRLANSSADGRNYQAVFDTIFFMTDGTPTSGKLQKPDDILAAVAEWNKNAQVTVHAIGVGAQCDVKFLEALATANHGVFVKR